jgi:hypothetical protein
VALPYEKRESGSSLKNQTNEEAWVSVRRSIEPDQSLGPIEAKALGRTLRMALPCASQCLDRGIPDKPAIAEEAAAWVENRNAHHAGAD